MSFEAHNLPKHNFTSVSSSQILKANIFRRAHNESTKSSVSIFFFTFVLFVLCSELEFGVSQVAWQREVEGLYSELGQESEGKKRTHAGGGRGKGYRCAHLLFLS